MAMSRNANYADAVSVRWTSRHAPRGGDMDINGDAITWPVNSKGTQNLH